MRTMKLLSVLALSASLFSCGSKEQETTSAAAVNPQAAKDQALLDAVQNVPSWTLEDRLTNIDKALKDGANPNSLNSAGEPVLADAVHYGDGSGDSILVVEKLISAGADVNAVAENGRSPLTKAAETNKQDVIELLLKNGLDLNTANGTRALVKAAFYEHNGLVRFFMKSGVKPNGLYGETLFSTSADESFATAAVFGSFSDIAMAELRPLLSPSVKKRTTNVVFQAMNQIQSTCEELNRYQFNPLKDGSGFGEATGCGSMEKLGSLAFMHCYGLIDSNHSALNKLQNAIDLSASQARDALKLGNVVFKDVKDPQELRGYDKSIRNAKALYLEFAIPLAKVASSRMGHHSHRNAQLSAQAAKCGRSDVSEMANNINNSIQSVTSSMASQSASYKKEVAQLEEIQANLEYQMPALDSGDFLFKKQEEEKRKLEEEKKAKEKKDSVAA